MFTGLIVKLGKIIDIEQLSSGLNVEIQVDTAALSVEIGDSIAVDGVCSTVVDFNAQSFHVQYLPETLAKTTFKNLFVGQWVNLEPSLTLKTKLGGHVVTGHVDDVGIISSIEKGDPWGEIIIDFDAAFAANFVYKGSVCLDGISLTVADVKETQLKCCIIPHTMEHTNLKYKQVGDGINIECDMLGKYILRSIELKKN